MHVRRTKKLLASTDLLHEDGPDIDFTSSVGALSADGLRVKTRWPYTEIISHALANKKFGR